jgi:predicted enzyme related to lactoylglutathione lyase
LDGTVALARGAGGTRIAALSALDGAIVMNQPLPIEAEFMGVRYQVADVQRSIDFYTRTLGFKVDKKNLPAFGQVSLGDFSLILSGPGGKQVQFDDPDGNPIELHQPP